MNSLIKILHMLIIVKKQISLRAKNLIRVRKFISLLSIFCIFLLPSCFSASKARHPNNTPLFSTPTITPKAANTPLLESKSIQNILRSKTYYVSGTGNDNNNGVSNSSPLRTIQKAANLTRPGDTVLVMNGVYSNSYPTGNVLTITRAGTPTGWIRYKAYPGHHPKLKFNGWNGIFISQGASYIEINGFEIEGNNDNITLEYAQSQKYNGNNPLTNGNGISIDGRKDGNNHPHHIRIVNNKVFKCGGAGISSIQADYVTIEKNKVFNNSWYTVYSTSGISTWQNWRFDNSQGYKTIIRNNKVYNNRNYIPWLAMGKIVDGNGIIIDDSKNTQNGSSLGAYTGRTLVENNLVFNNGGSGIHTYKSEHVDIINNTAYMNSQSPELKGGEIFANSSSDINIVNNILFALPREKVNSNYNNNNVYYDYNIYSNSRDIAVKGAHDLTVDPKFVNASINPTQLDLRLQPSSPAINKGLTWKAVISDYASNPRPSANRYDIGAYEYQF